MSDFFESNLCHPTAPREILFPHMKRIIKDVNKMADKNKDYRPTTSASNLLHRLLSRINSHSKKYSPMKGEKVNEVGELKNPSSCRWMEESEADESYIKDHSKDTRESRELSKRLDRIKFHLLMRAHLTTKGSRHEEGDGSDEDNLLIGSSLDLDNRQPKSKRKKRSKRFSNRRQEACNRVYEESKKVLSSKKKSFKKGCMNWAYGVVNLSATLPVYGGPSMTNRHSNFPCDHPFYFSPDPKRTFY